MFGDEPVRIFVGEAIEQIVTRTHKAQRGSPLGKAVFFKQ